MFLIVIALDGNDRNSGFAHHRQAFDSVVHRLRRDDTFMKEIAAHYDEIHFLFDAVALQNIDPRIKKITRTRRKLVSCAAEMHVGDVKKLHSVDFTTEEIHHRDTESTEIMTNGIVTSYGLTCYFNCWFISLCSLCLCGKFFS